MKLWKQAASRGSRTGQAAARRALTESIDAVNATVWRTADGAVLTGADLDLPSTDIEINRAILNLQPGAPFPSSIRTGMGEIYRI